MKKKELKNARARARQKTTMKMLTRPFWAYWVQILTTSLESLDVGGLLRQVHVFLDVDDRPEGAGHDRLHRGAGEPVDRRAAHQQAEGDLGLDEAEFA